MALDKGLSLTTLKVFKGIPERELVSIYNSLNQRKLKANEVLIKEGESINSLFLVVMGSLRAVRQTKKGDMTLLSLGRDALYGTLASDCNLHSLVTLIADEPTSLISINEKSLVLLKPDIKTRLLLNISCTMSMTENSLYNSLALTKDSVKSIADSLRLQYQKVREATSSSQMLQERLKKIPSLPPYSQELSSMLLRENISTDKIVEHIKSDPPLMALVLKTVNSPFYNMPQKVSDFHHAVLLLGFSQVYQIVMDNSLNSLMPQRPEFLELRDRAIAVSAFAFEIALLSGFQRPLLLNTIGTMHVIGKAVKMLLKKEQGLSETIDLFDDALIGASMLKEWKMPETIYNTITYYRYPEFSPPEFIPESVRKLVALLHISIACVEGIKNSQESGFPFIEDYLRLVGFTETLSDLTLKRIIPALRKRKDLLPTVLKSFLSEKD